MFWLGHGGWAPWGLGFALCFGLLKLLVLAAVIVLIITALHGRRRYQEYPRRPATNPALDILDARYARGEISAEEYKEMRHTLQA